MHTPAVSAGCEYAVHHCAVPTCCGVEGFFRNHLKNEVGSRVRKETDPAHILDGFILPRHCSN